MPTLRLFLAVIALAALLPAVASAQIPLPGVGTPRAAEASPETPEQQRQRIRTWMTEWRTAGDALDPAAVPPGISAEEAASRRSDLQTGVYIAESLLRSLDTADILGQSLVQAKEATAKWKGFAKPGPYSFTRHDELRRQAESVEQRLQAYESTAAMLDRELAKRQEEIRRADEAERLAQQAVDRADPAGLDAAAWRLESAKLRSRILGLTASLVQASAESTRLRLATATEEGALLKRKVAALGKEIAFPEQDIEQLRKNTDARRKEVEKEFSSIEAAQKTTLAARRTALAERDALKARAADAPEDSEERKKLAAVEARLQLLDAELESLTSRLEITGARVRLLAEYPDIQIARRTLVATGSPQERAKALETLKALHARAASFDSLVDVRRSAALSSLQEQEARLAAMDEGAPLRTATTRLAAAYRAELDAVERFGQEAASLHLDLTRWLADAELAESGRSWGERMDGLGARLLGWGKKVANLVVYRYEEKVAIDGDVVVRKRGLTLAWLVGALLFFWLAYRTGSALLKRGFRKMVGRGRVQQGQAETLCRWARIALGIVLALLTLHLLKIPLTAFAFLGGALAIGFGFGTQTIFKNLISGLIVLAERKVRVGDILEVDGIAGTVTAIDTRSSTVRSFDGVDMIVPNSVLLENKVVSWTHGTAMVRRVVRVGVAYGSPLRTVSTILAECAATHGVVAKSPEPQVVLEDFGQTALVFAIYYWIDLRGKTGGGVIASDLRFMIERRLGEAGIALVTPQPAAAPAR